MRRGGLEPIERPIAAADGPPLVHGPATPNSSPGNNFHSRVEWVSAQDMDKAVEVIVQLCTVWWESPG